MTIRRIKVAFVDPDGNPQSEVSGSIDRRVELIRQARSDLEKFRSRARREGDPRADVPFELSITDAPASETHWVPAR